MFNKFCKFFLPKRHLFIGTSIREMVFSFCQIICPIPQNYIEPFTCWLNNDTSIFCKSSHCKLLFLVRLQVFPGSTEKISPSRSLKNISSTGGFPVRFVKGFQVDLFRQAVSWKKFSVTSFLKSHLRLIFLEKSSKSFFKSDSLINESVA